MQFNGSIHMQFHLLSFNPNLSYQEAHQNHCTMCCVHLLHMIFPGFPIKLWNKLSAPFISYMRKTANSDGQFLASCHVKYVLFPLNVSCDIKSADWLNNIGLASFFFLFQYLLAKELIDIDSWNLIPVENLRVNYICNLPR